MSWELRPPVPTDKGTVVTELAAGLAAVCFVGDDTGDLPAFEALRRLGRLRRRHPGRGRGRTGDAGRGAGRRRPGRRRAAGGHGPARDPGRWAAAGPSDRASQARFGPRPAGRRTSRGVSGRPTTLRRACGPDRPLLRAEVEGRTQGPGRAAHVEGVDADGVTPQLVPGAGLVAQDQHPVALVDERALLGHQVEAVPDRVHQQHVGPAQGRHRLGVVVLRVEHDRRPVRTGRFGRG